MDSVTKNETMLLYVILKGTIYPRGAVWQSLFWVSVGFMVVGMIISTIVFAACAICKFNKPMIIYIAASTLADLSFGIISFSYTSWTYIVGVRRLTTWECFTESIAIRLLLRQKLTITFIMFLDRHLAIFHPYLYVRSMASRRGALTCLLIAWGVALMFTLAIGICLQFLVFCRPSMEFEESACIPDMLLGIACGGTIVPSMYLLLYTVQEYFCVMFMALYSSIKIILHSHKSNKHSKALSTCITQLLIFSNELLSSVVVAVAFKVGADNGPLYFACCIIVACSPVLANPLVFGIRVSEIRSVVTHQLYKLWKMRK